MILGDNYPFRIETKMNVSPSLSHLRAAKKTQRARKFALPVLFLADLFPYTWFMRGEHEYEGKSLKLYIPYLRAGGRTRSFCGPSWCKDLQGYLLLLFRSIWHARNLLSKPHPSGPVISGPGNEAQTSLEFPLRLSLSLLLVNSPTWEFRLYWIIDLSKHELFILI